MPPAPSRYFNDYASVVSQQTADALNQKLVDFEKATSSQVVVAVFPTMQSPSSVEDYVHRIFQAWQIGQKNRNNGVLLAVFVKERKLRIEVGYGLEGALPDAIAKRIIEEEITPHFKRGNFDAGLSAGVNAILQATRGEYKGSGRLRGSDLRRPPATFTSFVVFIILMGLMPLLARAARRGTVYGRSGRRRYSDPWWGSGWSTGGGWSSGGGGGGWSSGSSFSGGGGSSGGGGASGSW